MNTKRCLLVSEKEVRAQVKELYFDLIKDAANDILEGHSPIPAVVLQKGMDNLTIEELVVVANSGWSCAKLSAYNFDHPRNPCVAIIMFVEDVHYDKQFGVVPVKSSTGKSYLLTPEEIYPKDLV